MRKREVIEPDVSHAHETRFVIGGSCVNCKKGKKWKVKMN